KDYSNTHCFGLLMQLFSQDIHSLSIGSGKNVGSISTLKSVKKSIYLFLERKNKRNSIMSKENKATKSINDYFDQLGKEVHKKAVKKFPLRKVYSHHPNDPFS